MSEREEATVTKWNVLVGVVDLVEASSPEEAAAKLTASLTTAGYQVYEGQVPSVFPDEENSTSPASE